MRRATHLGARSPRSERVMGRGIANIRRSRNACRACSPAIGVTVAQTPTRPVPLLCLCRPQVLQAPRPARLRTANCKRMQNNANRNQSCDRRRRLDRGLDVRRACRSCVGQRGMVRSHRARRRRGILGLPIPDGRGMRAERTRWQPRHLYSKPIWRRTCRRVSTGQAAL